MVERIVAQGKEVNKDRVFIPTGTSLPCTVHRWCGSSGGAYVTGFQSKELIVRSQLLLGDVDQYPEIDVTIDGADE